MSGLEGSHCISHYKAMFRTYVWGIAHGLITRSIWYNVVTVASDVSALEQSHNVLSSILTCPNRDTLLCYNNDSFLTVYMYVHFQ